MVELVLISAVFLAAWSLGYHLGKKREGAKKDMIMAQTLGYMLNVKDLRDLGGVLNDEIQAKHCLSRMKSLKAEIITLGYQHDDLFNQVGEATRNSSSNGEAIRKCQDIAAEMVDLSRQSLQKIELFELVEERAKELTGHHNSD